MEEEPEDETPPSPEPFEPADDSDSNMANTPMEMEDLDDEIPPMEDLEPDLNFDDDNYDAAEPEPAKAKPASKPKPEPEPAMAEETIDENFDFDLSALDGTAAAPVTEEPPVDELEPEPEEDMAQAMLKAQGLDLAEDELDDAISHLIDELDGDNEPEKKPKDAKNTGEINLDDFDFGDDDFK